MPTTFTFRNTQDDAVELVIEPWALVETVEPGAVVTFEVNAAPPPEVEFSLTAQGSPYVYVMSERVVIHVDGEAKWDFEVSQRPPSDLFRFLDKALFSRRD